MIGEEGAGLSGVRLLRYAPAPDATLAIVRINGGVHLWDSDTSKQLAQVVPGPGGDPAKAADVAFHKDGGRLAVAAGDRVRFWNRGAMAFDGETVPVGGKEVTAVAYSPDGKTLAAGDSDGAVRLYENGDKASPRVLPGQGTAVRSLAFRPSGAAWLACGSADGTVRLWDLAKLSR